MAAFVPDDKIDEAKKAGADLAGNEDLIKQVEEGKINFDIAVASPKIMKDLGKIAKTLGQKGLGVSSCSARPDEMGQNSCERWRKLVRLKEGFHPTPARGICFTPG